MKRRTAAVFLIVFIVAAAIAAQGIRHRSHVIGRRTVTGIGTVEILDGAEFGLDPAMFVRDPASESRAFADLDAAMRPSICGMSAAMLSGTRAIAGFQVFPRSGSCSSAEEILGSVMGSLSDDWRYANVSADGPAGFTTTSSACALMSSAPCTILPGDARFHETRTLGRVIWKDCAALDLEIVTRDDDAMRPCITAPIHATLMVDDECSLGGRARRIASVARTDPGRLLEVLARQLTFL